MLSEEVHSPIVGDRWKAKQLMDQKVDMLWMGAGGEGSVVAQTAVAKVRMHQDSLLDLWHQWQEKG